MKRAENDDNTNDDVDRDYRVKKSTAGTKEKVINRMQEESEKRGIDESTQ